MKKIAATVEARYASTRLPGKTLLKILGKPALELMIERLKMCKRVEQIVIATSVNPDCQPIEDLAKRLGVGVFRGSEDDVLDRVLRAAKKYNAEVIVETTGDEILIDPKLIDEAIDYYFANNFDYVSNILDRRYPRGLDTQVFSVKVLDDVAKLTKDPADRENVSLYIYEHPERFKLGGIKAPPELDHPEWRWTLDTQDDLNFIREVYERLYYKKNDFDSYDVLGLLTENPELLKINSHICQKQVR